MSKEKYISKAESDKKNQKRYKNTLQAQDAEYPFQAGDGNLGKRQQKSKRIKSHLGKYSLTEKQYMIFKFIANHIQHVGFPPTVREVAIYFSISAKAAHDHLRAIAKKGYLRLFSGAARGMELLKTVDGEPIEEQAKNTLSKIATGETVSKQSQAQNLIDLDSSTVVIPLIGSIAAGVPILAEENTEDYLSFPASFLPASGEMFALRVRGDSMEGAGIFDGDIAVIRKINSIDLELHNGDIVAALIEDEATLKTFRKNKKAVELHPENSRYSVIFLEQKYSSSIMGKLVGVYRSYR